MSATVAAVRDIDPSRLDIEDLAAHFRTDLDGGLTSQDAEQRLAEDGPNELRAAPPVPQWRKLVRQFKDPLIYLLLGAVLVSTVVWLVEGREGLPIDALVIATVVVMNAVLGYLQEARAERAVAALQKMTAVSAGVIRDGQPLRVPSAQLVRGDMLTLAEGDAVGADARLIASAALHVQEASLTGESEAVLKEVGT